MSLLEHKQYNSKVLNVSLESLKCQVLFSCFSRHYVKIGFSESQILFVLRQCDDGKNDMVRFILSL